VESCRAFHTSEGGVLFCDRRKSERSRLRFGPCVTCTKRDRSWRRMQPVRFICAGRIRSASTCRTDRLKSRFCPAGLRYRTGRWWAGPPNSGSSPFRDRLAAAARWARRNVRPPDLGENKLILVPAEWPWKSTSGAVPDRSDLPNAIGKRVTDRLSVSDPLNRSIRRGWHQD
jgi:hypothetical protein